MREWIDIVAAFRSLCDDDKPSALATVVAVDGSAYRRPGARMLIAEDGRTWGGVSGGCLERDVAERARGVLATGRAFLHRYDTTDAELIERGVSTGCGGTIDVLIQPLSAEEPGPIDLIAATLSDRRQRLVATVMRGTGAWRDLAGTAFDAAGDASVAVFGSERLVARVTSIDVRKPRLASEAAEQQGDHDQAAWDALDDAPPSHIARHVRMSLIATLTGLSPCEQNASTFSKWVADGETSAEIFFARLLPPQRLVIVGGGADAVPVVAIAKTLGWCVAVVAARPALPLASRFAAADERYVTPPDDPLAGVPIGPADAVVVMTHNLARDAAALAALTLRPRYLGLLGPRHRTARVIDTLPARHPGRDPVSPVGLDIGSETPEEIALSVVAEIQACVRRVDASPTHAGAACPA